MVTQRQNEKAWIIVNGTTYEDWETVLVRHALREVPPYRFRFTCSEDQPLGNAFLAMRIRPGDVCTVILAGHLAITGRVTTRQVFVDAHRHMVEIQGSTWATDLSSVSVTHPTHELKNANFQQIAQAALKGTGVGFRVEGGALPDTKFERVAITPGQSVIDLLDTYSRYIGVTFTSDSNGEFVAIVGPNGGDDTVYEGNLGRPSYMEGREVIFNEGQSKGLPTMGQRPGNNKQWGPEVAQVFDNFKRNIQGWNFNSLPQTILSEAPTWSKQHAQSRSRTDSEVQAEDMVTVTVTVYGWERPSGGSLWYRDQIVRVQSPMLIMYGAPLTLKSVTFLQDSNKGTRSVLECCNKNALGEGQPQIGSGQ